MLFLFQMQNHVNPAMDFTQTPPGMLALDNMLYLAKVHQDTYIRVSVGLYMTLHISQRWWSQPNPTCLLTHDRLCWRTAAARTNTNVPSAGVPSNSLECCARFSRLENCVSRSLSERVGAVVLLIIDNLKKYQQLLLQSRTLCVKEEKVCCTNYISCLLI